MGGAPGGGGGGWGSTRGKNTTGSSRLLRPFSGGRHPVKRFDDRLQDFLDCCQMLDDLISLFISHTQVSLRPDKRIPVLLAD